MKNREKYDNTRWEKEAELQEASQSNSKDYVNCSYASYASSTRKLSEAKIDSEASVSEGGSLRYNKGKPQFSHLSPDFILEMMKVMTSANSKYPYLNYTKMQDVRTASDSLMRHFLSFQNGADLDSESMCHHLAHVATNAMIIFQNLKDFGDKVDNRYSKEKDRVND